MAATQTGDDPLAQEPAAGGDVGEFLAKVDALKNKAPASALAACQRWLAAHPKANTDECYWLYARISDIQSGPLSDVPAAIKTCQEGFARAGGKGSAFMIRSHEMDLLASTNRLTEAETIGAKDAVEAARQGYPQLLGQYADVLIQLGKGDQAFALLRENIAQIPQALADENGRFYDKMIEHQLLGGQEEDALAWAKLRFTLCAFADAPIQQATDSISKVIASKELSFSKVQAFLEALKDPAKPNQLKDVALPISANDVRKALSALPPTTGAHDRITMLLAAGAYREAMMLARGRLVSDIGSADAVGDVCRVFKAADLNLNRANDFIDYMKTGQGDNPMTAFLKQQSAEPAKTPAG